MRVRLISVRWSGVVHTTCYAERGLSRTVATISDDIA